MYCPICYRNGVKDNSGNHPIMLSIGDISECLVCGIKINHKTGGIYK